MKFKTTLFAIQATALLSLPLANAQSPAPGITDGPNLHIDIVHDQPENDPSDPKKALTLKKFIYQEDYAWQETLKKLANLTMVSFSETLASRKQ